VPLGFPVSATLHAWQLGHVALPQQTPSTHKPEAHCVPVVHVWPSAGMHCPEALQVLAPPHESGSVAFVTGEQTPGFASRLHASQVPHEGLSQHAPSTQLPVSQSRPEEHDEPPRTCKSHVSPK
jgi:hypothetical protein